MFVQVSGTNKYCLLTSVNLEPMPQRVYDLVKLHNTSTSEMK